MKYSYYYPDTEAEFEDYSNGCDPDPLYDFKDVSCWSADYWDVGTDQFFQRTIIKKERLEEALSLIDDIKED